MTNLITQPAADTASRRHFELTVEKPVLLSDYEKVIPNGIFRELTELFPNGSAQF